MDSCTPGEQDALGRALAARDGGGRVGACRQNVQGLERRWGRLALEAVRLVAAQQRSNCELLHRDLLQHRCSNLQYTL